MFRLISRSSTKYRRHNTTKLTPFSHCNFCGNKYQNMAWPKKCNKCNNTTWNKQDIVVVGLVPVRHNMSEKVGLLITRRSINPKKGGWCLPGGFLDVGETWKEGMSREVFEETTLEINPEEFELIAIEYNEDKSMELKFGITHKIRTIDDLKTFESNDEVSEIMIGNYATELCFPLHQKIFKRVLMDIKFAE